jgi:hypothetical protein
MPNLLEWSFTSVGFFPPRGVSRTQPAPPEATGVSPRPYRAWHGRCAMPHSRPGQGRVASRDVSGEAAPNDRGQGRARDLRSGTRVRRGLNLPRPEQGRSRPRRGSGARPRRLRSPAARSTSGSRSSSLHGMRRGSRSRDAPIGVVTRHDPAPAGLRAPGCGPFDAPTVPSACVVTQWSQNPATRRDR